MTSAFQIRLANDAGLVCGELIPKATGDSVLVAFAEIVEQIQMQIAAKLRAAGRIVLTFC